jgi:hypothetical protein
MSKMMIKTDFIVKLKIIMMRMMRKRLVRKKTQLKYKACNTVRE